MTIPEENIAELQRSLDEIIAEELKEEDFKEEILISDSLEIGAVTQKMIEEMNQLAPYGMGNPKPVFKITAIPSDKRQIGSKKNHLKLQLAEKETVLDCIGFGMGEYFYRIAPHTPVQAVGELGINEWNGNRKPQLMIQDMKINEWQLFDYRGRKNIDWSFLHDKKVLAVSIEPLVKLNTHQIDYQTENRDLVKTDHLVLVDLPERLDDLIRILQATKPENIYAAFQLKESAYLMAFPAREDFVWLYALIHKQKTIDLKQAIQTIMKMKSWSKDRVIFMIKVFQELDFIAVSDGVVKLHPNPAKQSLDASETYQARLRQQDIEQKLYYSNYEQFKNWFRAHMDDVWKPEEELVNGP
jgi:single-stranded-DNA-specific exonuclease